MTKVGIIGNGVAATSAIRELKGLDSDIEIDVFGDERHAYYPKPNLMEYVGGKRTQEEVIRYGPEWYENQGVNLHLATPVSHIDAGIRSLTTPSKIFTGYDALLLAVGSYPFVPPFEGLDKKNVHVMRTFDDAIDIKEAVASAGREIIVGGGILGIELAAGIKKIGGDPIVVTNVDRLLPIQLDGGASEILRKHLEDMGVTSLMGFTCTGVLGDDTAEGVISSAGDSIDGDLVVIATGVRSNVELARKSNLSIRRGIEVDRFMQTSAPRIYAAGDCAECDGEWYGIIPWALETSKIAARNMVEHGSARFEGITPANTLKVAGIDLSSIGKVHVETPEYEQIISVDREKGTYYKAVIKDNVVVGGISLGNREVAMRIRQLVTQAAEVTDIRTTLFEPE
ncbi:MAG: NAD(P)/FAD-dependent oxidoreductase [Candidatus Thorarchaeota archaeon]|jgi:nitrite reductase (NADH) large subunit